MCWEGASGSLEIPSLIDDSDVDSRLLDEWDRLAERECALEQQLQQIEQSVLEKYPHIKTAHIIMSAALPNDDRTLLLRYAALIRMKRRVCLMIEAANREIASAQKKARKELDEVNHLLAGIEAQIEKQARKRRVADVEYPTKMLGGE